VAPLDTSLLRHSACLEKINHGFNPNEVTHGTLASSSATPVMGISLCIWSLWGGFSQHLGLLLEQLGQHLGLLLEQLGQQHLGCFVRTAGQRHLDCFYDSS
jgi:hypothetical protein